MTQTAVWILGDQLLMAHPALPSASNEVVVLFIESMALLQKRPHQPQRLGTALP